MRRSPSFSPGRCRAASCRRSRLARKAAVADFYRGKTVTLTVGYSAGGGYDTYARILARHMGRHIPGNPPVVVQNMPGAGCMRAANISTTSRRRTAPPSACSAAASRWSR